MVVVIIDSDDEIEISSTQIKHKVISLDSSDDEKESTSKNNPKESTFKDNPTTEERTTPIAKPVGVSPMKKHSQQPSPIRSSPPRSSAVLPNKNQSQPSPIYSSSPRSSFVIPDKWSSQSSLESRKELRMSKNLLAKAMSSKPEPKISLPRSALLKSSSSSSSSVTAKRPSSIIKAASPIKKPLASSISASLKRTIKSPERPPKSLLSNRARHGSPERSPSQRIPMHGSPERSAAQPSSVLRGSPVRLPSNTVSTAIPTASPPDLCRPKTSSSPFSRPEFERHKTFYDIDDEDGEEENLKSFVNVMANTRRRVIVDNTPKKINMQCPVCYLWFTKQDIGGHAAECTGDPGDDVEVDGKVKAGRKRGIRKNTFAAAVALDEAERKRQNKGKIDTGPTNYYADSESILALDGIGFNSEVTGISWESAGQTRFG